MAKDERIWIPDNYYNGFLKGCMANELIEDTPSKTALENSGCQISALCYLILPDGSQHNPRIMKPNEFPSSIRKLFEIIPDAEYPDEIPAVLDTVGKELKDVLQEATHQVCDICKENKPFESFKKMPGRGVRRRTTCIECEAKSKAYGKPNAHPISTEEFKERAAEILTGPDQLTSNPLLQRCQIDAKIVAKRATVCVSLDYLKRLATEAYERGREFERSNILTVEPSLDELLLTSVIVA